MVPVSQLLHENGHCCEIHNRWNNRKGIKGTEKRRKE
jgi:hypothetical protein